MSPEVLQDRIDYHSKVALPDWLDHDPPRAELEAAMAFHVWILACAENCIRQIEVKLNA